MLNEVAADVRANLEGVLALEPVEFGLILVNRRLVLLQRLHVADG